MNFAGGINYKKQPNIIIEDSNILRAPKSSKTPFQGNRNFTPLYNNTNLGVPIGGNLNQILRNNPSQYSNLNQENNINSNIDLGET